MLRRCPQDRTPSALTRSCADVPSWRVLRVKTILVIEDDPVIGEFLADLLQLAGYRSMLAYDGVTGLACLRDARPDLVLCDLRLPLMDGASVAGAMREEPALRATPLVLMSADPTQLEGAARRHGHPSLLKPIGVQSLLTTIAAQLGEPCAMAG